MRGTLIWLDVPLGTSGIPVQPNSKLPAPRRTSAFAAAGSNRFADAIWPNLIRPD